MVAAMIARLLLALIVLLGWAPAALATFPVEASTAQTSEFSATASPAINIPSGNAAGNLLIALANLFNPSNTDPTVSSMTGWTALCSVTNSDTSFSSVTAVYYKFASGAESNTTYSLSTAIESATRVLRITGAHASTPPECATNEFTGDFPNTPSLTPSWGAEDTLFYSIFSKYNGSDSINAYPTNYIKYQYNGGGGALPLQVGTAARELNATSDDPDGYNLDGAGNGVGITLAIRPAAAAAATSEADQPIYFQ